MSFFWGHWYPCFGFLVTSPLGFKARVGSTNVMYSPLRSTSGATHANLLVAGIAASHFPRCMCRGWTWLRFERAITRTEDERATIVPATRLFLSSNFKFDFYF